MMLKLISLVLSSVLAIFASSVNAGSLLERGEKGKVIRIGFANEVPWAYPGEKNAPMGFANVHTIAVLQTMGYTNIESVVTEWGGLIPGLKAGRFDIIKIGRAHV